MIDMSCLPCPQIFVLKVATHIHIKKKTIYMMPIDRNPLTPRKSIIIERKTDLKGRFLIKLELL